MPKQGCQDPCLETTMSCDGHNWWHCSVSSNLEAALQCCNACAQVADKGPIGLCQHPHRNLVATWATEGVLNLWKAA